MWLFRGDRYRTARSILAALLVYVVAATGMLGSVARAASGLESSGFVVICTMDGTSIAKDGSAPVTKAQTAQHCGLCQAGTAIAVPPADAGLPVPAPRPTLPVVRPFALVTPPAPADALIGALSPRAPPFTA